MRSFRRSIPLAGVAASTLLLAACSSGGNAPVAGSGTGASRAPASSSASSSSAPASPPTTAQLQKIVIQASDLPSTYTASPAAPDTGTDSTTAQIEACTGVKGAPTSHRVGHAQSSDFKLGNVTLSSSFNSYQSQSDIDADVALLKSPQINSCLNSVLADGLAKAAGAKVKITETAIKLTPGPNGGPSNVAGLASGVVKFAAGGQQAAVYLGIAFVTGPLLGGTLSYVSLGAPLGAATSSSVLAAVAKRAANP